MIRVADIQRFCMHDGPGVRTTVFLKGCPLRCRWCHNPETQRSEKEILLYESKCIGCSSCLAACENDAQIFSDIRAIDRERCVSCGRCALVCPTNALEVVGEDYTKDRLLEIIEKDRPFYGEMGGVTLSGGEPLLQGEAIELLSLCRGRGISTAVETCGYVSSDTVRKAVPLVDVFLWDIKDTDPVRHERYTGKGNERIIENLFVADSLGAKTRLRCILVSGVNTEREHYKRIADLYHRLTGCEGVELLPYHSYGGAKAAALGIKSDLCDSCIPSKEDVLAAKEYLKNKNVVVL